MGDDGIEGAVLVRGETAVLNPQRACTDDLVLRHLDEARFANPRLSAQYHDVALAGLDLCPSVSQYTHFVLSAHQRCEAAGHRDVEALLHLGRAYDLVDLEGCGHAFERLGPEGVAGEIALDQSLRHRADDHSI